MTTKEKIEVMQAYLDGKQIQSKAKRPRYRVEGGWADWTSHKQPVWDFWSCEYRIKPEPRIPIEEWRIVYEAGDSTGPFGSHIDAEAYLLTCGEVGGRIVHFREVIEDEENPSES